MKTSPQTLRKISLRIIPLIVICYFVTFLDRVNVGVAGVQMNRDLGLTSTAFGIGAGLFFVTYIPFETPSNILMYRFGARVWIPRILITIGLVAATTSLITGPTGFYAFRLLLGMVEAGAAPAFVLYLSLWFPASVRPRMFAYYFVAIPLASIIGAPVGGLLLRLDGVAGLSGWQWVFLCPAGVTIALGVASYFLFVDGPADAKWLSPHERTLLQEDLESSLDVVHGSDTSRFKSLLRPALIAMAVIHLAGNIANYTLSFFLPQIIKALGVTDFAAASLSALPYVAGALALLYFGRRSSRQGLTRTNLALPFAIGIAGFLVAGLSATPVIVLLGLCMGAIGGLGYLPAFWCLPARSYTGVALATSIALINSFGNFGGLIGPSVMGYVRDQTDSFGAGLLFCAAVVTVGVVASVLTVRRGRVGPNAALRGGMSIGR